MGAKESKTPDFSPQPQMSEAQVKRFFEAQRKEFERNRQQDALITAQKKLTEVANSAAQLRKNQNELIIAAQKKLQEEAASIAAQIILQEENFITAQSKLQEEAATLAAHIKLQEEAFIVAQNKLQEKAFIATQRKLQVEVLIAAQKKIQEEAFITAKRKIQEEAAIAVQSKLQEAAIKRKLRKKAATRRYCSTCYTKSITKMFECKNRHGSCNDCKTKGRSCGICRRNLTSRRSYHIQNHVAQTKVPCPYARQGCVLLIKIADMKNHMQECPYKEHDCPLAAIFGNCGWSSEISELSSHFADMHPKYLLIKAELCLRNIYKDGHYVRLVELDYHFIFHLKVSKQDSKVYMAIQLIGTKFSAMKWLYEVHVYNKVENRRKYMYTDTCRSSIDDMDEVFRSGECAVLPTWYANTFFNKELTCKFFIMTTHDNRTGFDRNQRGID